MSEFSSLRKWLTSLLICMGVSHALSMRLPFGGEYDLSSIVATPAIKNHIDNDLPSQIRNSPEVFQQCLINRQNTLPDHSEPSTPDPFQSSGGAWPSNIPLLTELNHVLHSSPSFGLPLSLDEAYSYRTWYTNFGTHDEARSTASAQFIPETHPEHFENYAELAHRGIFTQELPATASVPSDYSAYGNNVNENLAHGYNEENTPSSVEPNMFISIPDPIQNSEGEWQPNMSLINEFAGIFDYSPSDALPPYSAEASTSQHWLNRMWMHCGEMSMATAPSSLGTQANFFENDAALIHDGGFPQAFSHTPGVQNENLEHSDYFSENTAYGHNSIPDPIWFTGEASEEDKIQNFIISKNWGQSSQPAQPHLPSFGWFQNDSADKYTSQTLSDNSWRHPGQTTTASAPLSFGTHAKYSGYDAELCHNGMVPHESSQENWAHGNSLNDNLAPEYNFHHLLAQKDEPTSVSLGRHSEVLDKHWFPWDTAKMDQEFFQVLIDRKWAHHLRNSS